MPVDMRTFPDVFEIDEPVLRFTEEELVEPAGVVRVRRPEFTRLAPVVRDTL